MEYATAADAAFLTGGTRQRQEETTI